MLNTLVYNPRFYEGSQWALFVATHGVAGECKGDPCTYYWPKRNLNQSKPFPET